MCVILAIGPNIDIEEQKIISACEVNNDGYGLTVINDGKFDTFRSIKPNKPDDLMKRLEDARGYVRMVHLRFRTDGDVSEENCHPFVVTTQEEHGLDIQFMHNGVISDFSGGNDAESDTHKFNSIILKPLLIRTLKTLEDPTKWSEDPLFKILLNKYAGANNVFTIYDSLGGHVVTNKSRGVEHQGWWASNAYSFNRTHRTPTYDYGNYSKSSGYWDKGAWKDFPKGTGSSCTVPNTPAKKEEVKPPFAGQGAKDVPKLEDHRRKNKERMDKLKASAPGVKRIVDGNVDTGKYLTLDIIPPEKRPTFQDITGIELNALAFLELQDIDDLITAHPELTTILIMDLLFDRQLYAKANKADKQLGVG